MRSIIYKLKVIVKNNKTRQPISGAYVYWAIIPETVKKKSEFFKKFKDSENELQIDVTNKGGFSLILGKLGHDTKLWFFIHKIACPGFKEIKIENIISIIGGSEKEFIVYLYPDDE